MGKDRSARMEQIDIPSQELGSELARVGITDDALMAAARAGATHTPPESASRAVRSFTLLFEFEPALRALRALEDGAGIEAFLAQLYREAPKSRLLQGWTKSGSA